MAIKAAKRVTKKPDTLSLAWDPDKGPSDGQVDAALRILRADYWTSIRSTARDIVAAIDSGELTSEDELSERVHEYADGSYWTIYTHANYRAMMASDCDESSEASDMGLENPTSAQLAYCCVRHDLTDQITAECDGDVNARIESAAKKASK